MKEKSKTDENKFKLIQYSNMSLNAAASISTMNLFKRSNVVNEIKIICLGKMEFIDVNIKDGINIQQEKNILDIYISLLNRI